ncbi:MAG TPA: class I SAM-dependent methyltransferase [Anaerolineales bacterium]|nr:class I SAM-dependent methyltransferase [Anaerolineales bacterium]
MLTSEQLRQLQSPAGEQALAEAETVLDLEPDFLRAVQRLASKVPESLARAAVDQTILRRRAAAKFVSSSDLFFTKEGLEQATPEPVARHRARRFSGFKRVLDLGCGIGGDALALAAHAPVLAADLDVRRLEILGANARRRALGPRIDLVCADVRLPFLRVPPGTAAFADPSRRREGRRTRRTELSAPPLSALLGWLPELEAMAVKVSPAVDLEELRALPCEVEFISLDGELKEATLWFGSLRRGSIRATILPAGLSLEGDPPELTVGPLGAYLCEPDPAVMRAGLVGMLGASLGARLVSPGIGYLTLDDPVTTPFGRTFQIRQAAPFRLKSLQGMLAEADIGRLTIKRRGSPVEPEAIERRLKLRGGREGILILTRVAGASFMLLAEPLGPEPEG